MEASVKSGKMKKLRDWAGRMLDTHPVIFTAVLAFIDMLIIESASRHSPFAAIAFIFVHPVNFLANYFIVLTTISLAHLFRKRVFFLTLFSSIWALAGIVNGVVLAFRVTPFGLIDISLLPSVGTIFTVYLDWWQIALLAVMLLLFIAALVAVFIRSGKRPVKLKMAAVLIAGSVLLAVGTYSVTVVGHEDTREEVFSNVAGSYRTYGFVYCFCTGAVDRGVSRPEFYSRAAVNWLVGNLDEPEQPRMLPNIIMVQLESFFDVSYLGDVSFQQNPIPVFTDLKDRYTSGFLTVPSVGAGTANTEFEVLSGMSLDFFGMGEYPYKTILQEEACESLVWDLKELGYTGTAIHNNTATFYNRDQVFAQLGFDNFTSIEYMDNVEYNPIGWAKDAVLTQEILKALDATRDQDFIFTITVQGHGKYQRGVDSVDTEHLGITWATDPDSQDAFAYYTEQLEETDAFIGELIDALSRRAEPTVVVLYGDHLPNFDIGSEELTNGDIFETEYVMWSNFRLPEDDEDLSAYQLSAKVLSELGMSRGLLFRYHRQMRDTPDYLDGLKLLEHDMLYGDFYCYGGENPYTATDLKMGVEPVSVTGYEIDEEAGLLRVTGQNFTDWSVLSVGGEKLETTRAEDGSLTASLEEAGGAEELRGKVLTVCQDTVEGLTLSESVGLFIK